MHGIWVPFTLSFFVSDSKKDKKRQTKDLLKSTQKFRGIFVTVAQCNEKYFHYKYLNIGISRASILFVVASKAVDCGPGLIPNNCVLQMSLVPSLDHDAFYSQQKRDLENISHLSPVSSVS